MDDFMKLMTEMNLTPEKLAKLQSAAAAGPFGIMSALGELDLPPDFLPRLMGAIMANPNALKEMMNQVGPENIPQDLKNNLDDMLKDR